jgi:rhamnulokinase
MAQRLAIDVGSSSVKIHAGKYDDGTLQVEEIERLDNHTRRKDGRHIWAIDDLTAALRGAIDDAVDRYGEVSSVGIDATALDFGLLADGELLRNPYFYRDPSLWTTEDEAADLCSERRAFELTGYNLTRGPMHYQAHADRDLFERADTLVPLPQLLGYELGSEAVTEQSYAMTLQMFDIQSQEWADELIEAIGFPRHVLDEPVPAGTSAGTVDTDGTGPEREPEIILPPSHDTAAAVGSLPLTPANNAFLATGSWFIPGLELPEPIVTDEVFEIGGSNEVGVEGTVRFLRNLPGFSLLELCREQWKAEGRTYEYEPLLDRAAAIGTDVPLIDPRDELFVDAQFEGDVEKRVQRYCERTDQRVPADEHEVTACLMVSLATGTAMVLDELIAVADETVERVHLGGGGVRNDLFCQYFASTINRPVRAGPTEATALGNVLVQMRSTGEISDIEEGRELVADAFDVTEYEPTDRDEWASVRERLEALAGRA